MRGARPGLTLREHAARAAMAAVNVASRRLGRGEGTVAGGRVGLAAAPGLLEHLAAQTQVVLVSGTNGKTTTTACLAAALRVRGQVATNATGSNMLEGHAAALGTTPRADFSVLECDEVWLPRAIAIERPCAVVLLNLSRDQLDRTSEVHRIAERWRVALDGFAGICVANADDPLVAAAAAAAASPVFYAGGRRWGADATACLQCGRHLEAGTDRWSCRCGASRPDPVARAGEGVVELDGRELAFTPRLPGAFNRANATAALLAASRLGVGPEAAAAAIASVDQVAGRFSTIRVGATRARLLLAKNPAGWHEVLDLLDRTPTPLVLAVNARVADGHDPSWLYDVDFERLRGRRVVVAGERWRDLSTRLFYADVDHEVEADPRAAVARAGGADVDVVANYTAFADLVAGR